MWRKRDVHVKGLSRKARDSPRVFQFPRDDRADGATVLIHGSHGSCGVGGSSAPRHAARCRPPGCLLLRRRSSRLSGTGPAQRATVPNAPSGVCPPRAFGEAHGRYAHYANALRNRSGHFWQNRFFSCALETTHLWAALRYVERNPLRAGLVAAAGEWPWSSAGARMGSVAWPDWLDAGEWRAMFTAEDWRTCLVSSEWTEAELRLRINTYTGRPAGSAAFLAKAEAALCRRLEPKKGGRPRKVQGSGIGAADRNQGILFSGV